MSGSTPPHDDERAPHGPALAGKDPGAADEAGQAPRASGGPPPAAPGAGTGTSGGDRDGDGGASTPRATAPPATGDPDGTAGDVDAAGATAAPTARAPDDAAADAPSGAAVAARRAAVTAPPALPVPAPAPVAPAAADAAHGGACENCATPLRGAFCHRCGQSAHNPIHHLGHAVEEVFESFWHLDGRIFRTLRELFAPGRVARDYLAGHRVRYIPPLRLFVVLSLLTFFVGKLVLHFDADANLGGAGTAAVFAGDTTVAQVERHRDELLAELREAEREAGRTPGVKPALIASRARIQGEAASRIAQLRDADEASGADPAVRAEAASAEDGAGTPPDGAASDANAATRRGDPALDRATGAANVPAPAPAAAIDGDDAECAELAADSRHPGWMPAFAGKWIQARVSRACRNLKHADTESGRLFQSFMGAIPGALFVLMPVFALLLKLVYLGSGRSYLEHLVVALYSHAFLLLVLLGAFLLAAAGGWGAPAWAIGLGGGALWIWTPLYLLLTQKRVYAGGWFSTIVRYLAIGTVYFMLVVMVTVYAALMGVSS